MIDSVQDSFSTTSPQKKQNVIWRGMKVVINFFYKTPAMIAAIAVASIICQFVFPVLAPTLYTLAAATLFSLVTIKVLAKLNFQIAHKLEAWVCKVKSKFPRIQVVALIVTLITGCFVWFLGVGFALALGLYNGCISEIDYCKKIQQIRKYQHDNNENIDEISNLMIG